MTNEKDPIIEMYLKKSWKGRLAKVFVFALIFLCIGAFGSYYYYGVSSLEHRAKLREASPIIEQAANYLDEQGWIPLAPEEAEAQELAKANRKEKPAVTYKYPEIIDERVPVEVLTTPEDRRNHAAAEEALARSLAGKSEPDAIPVDESNRNVFVMEGNPSEGTSANPLLDVSKSLAQLKDHSVKTVFVKNLDGSELSYSGDALDALRVKTRERLLEHAELADRYLEEGTAPIYWKVWDQESPITGDDFQGLASGDPSLLNQTGSSFFIDIVFTSSDMSHNVFPIFDKTRSTLVVPEFYPNFIEEAQMTFDLAEVYSRYIREMASNYSQKVVHRHVDDPMHSPNQQRLRRSFPREFYAQVRAMRSEFHSQVDAMRDDLKGSNSVAKYHEWKSRIANDLKKREAFKLKVDWEKMRNSRQPTATFVAAQYKETGYSKIKPSEIKARKWYQYATNVDSGEAANNLARMHMLGLGGLDRDPAKAYNTLASVVKEEGSYVNPITLLNLGIKNYRGIGSRQDKETGLAQIKKASRQSSLARFALEKIQKEQTTIDTSKLAPTWSAGGN
jgi:hypothetical protein